jgi:hypothetical protein
MTGCTCTDTYREEMVSKEDNDSFKEDNVASDVSSGTGDMCNSCTST